MSGADRGRDLLGALDGSAPQDGLSREAPTSPGAETGPQETPCSRRGCRAPARWRLEWNNPRVHTPERRKIWLACDEHREWLTDYLRSRNLLREVVPYGDEGPGRRTGDETDAADDDDQGGGQR